MKAADITDTEFLDTVDRALLPHGEAMLWDVQAAFAGFPPKVVLAKAKSLVRRGLILGCACGCRGDFRRAASSRKPVV